MPTYRMNVALSWPAAGGPGVNTWHVRDDGVVPGDIDNLVEAIGAWYEDVLLSGLVCDGYRAQFDGTLVDVANDEITQSSTFDYITNGAGASFAPLASQACFTMRTSSATKSGLGRKFVGPINRSAVAVDGSIDNTLRAALQGFCDTLVNTSESSANGAVGVYSASQSIFRDITQMQARDYVAVLRSRRD